MRYIDGLRAYAVLAVVAAHHSLFLIPASMGVTIFFVISGFVITRLLIKEYQHSDGFRAKAFFARRGLKIIPPFLVAITIPTLILWPTSNFNPFGVISQHFFYYNWYQIGHYSATTSINSSVLPGSQVVWSLAVEEQFYILVAIVWLLFSHRHNSVRVLRYAYLSAFFGSMVIRYFVSMNGHFERNAAEGVSRIVWGTDCRLSSIALGGLLAIATSGEKPLLASKNWILDFIHRFGKYFFVLGFLLIFLTHFTHKIFGQTFGDVFDLTFQECASFLLIATGLAQHGWPNWIRKVTESKPIQVIGLASYSIYLSHDVFRQLVTVKLLHLDTNELLRIGGIIPVFHGFANIFPGLIIAAIVSIIPGLIIHQIADAPMEKFRKRWRIQSKEVEAIASTSS